MIVVNTAGTGVQAYNYLIHAQWFGFTLADLVFSSFLFAVGNAKKIFEMASRFGAKISRKLISLTMKEP